MPQPMHNPRDNLDPTTVMNATLSLLAKAFKVNTIPTNNNQRSSLIHCNSQIAQPGMNTSQDIKMKMVDENVSNQYGNRKVKTTPPEGNGNGINETGRVKVNCTSEDTLQQASTSITQSDNAPVYDSDGSTEKLEDENMSLEFQVLNYAKENAHLKTTYKNLFDSIKVTQAQTNSIIDSLQKQLYDTIYENAKLRAQLFDKVSEQEGISKGTRTNTMFTKQSILGKPPSSSFKPKLYSITPFPKSLVLPKGVNSLGKKQKANVPNIANQKKHMAQVWKPKNVGSKERLASPKHSTPRSCLRWSPTGRFFDLKGKIIASSESESQSDCSKGDNACTSNSQEPISKRFPSSTFSMTGCQNWLYTLLIRLLSEYKPNDKEDHEDNEYDFDEFSVMACNQMLDCNSFFR
uniref:Integrase, catalytic region, zinc finger, CCHC-type, peptidase aspartic, catalytic n=1 Tax=Tanacetum cinerariifolium TaxID=118510 RepID=A0A6L2J5A4_TANCI|nr:hypothetical protein [Tanacetum cinerariifolium]